ncbi:MAG: sugar phosphate isomerase/epimerase [Clostridia bacterium]|nr:sugar phosphate isomerase/epimerase [Clostridia bacterium]
MRFGVCFRPNDIGQVAVAKAAGFDYMECNFVHVSRMDDETFASFAAALREHGLPCGAACVLLPGEMSLHRGFDPEETAAFLREGLKRLVPLGLERVSFGSGGARGVPEGVTYPEAAKNLIRALRDVIGPVTAEFGVTVAIEPLRRNECNMINTLREGAMLAAAVGLDNVKLLVDVYHMAPEETLDDIRKMKGVLAHAHISQPFSTRGLKRDYPTDPDAYDYKGFLDAAAEAGVPTCSVEADCVDFNVEYPAAARLLKSL